MQISIPRNMPELYQGSLNLCFVYIFGLYEPDNNQKRVLTSCVDLRSYDYLISWARAATK